MRIYKHDYKVNSHYTSLYPSNSVPADHKDFCCCYFWDADTTLPESTDNVDYVPVARMNLNRCPTVGTYISFNSILYMITAVCISARENNGWGSNSDVYYDIEVKKVTSSEELD